MPKMRRSERDALPRSAFAYVDANGVRRLPIHDAQHVRNALARFGRVRFESEAARELARKRILRAAARHGILPLGFITNQIAARDAVVALPSGEVTFLLSDVEGSTQLVQQLVDGYAAVIEEVREIHRLAVREGGGHEVDARADEFFGVIAQARSAVSTALSIRERLALGAWPAPVNVRIGIHTGHPSLARVGYVGIDVHVAARVSNAAHGGQILVSADARDAVEQAAGDFDLRSLGWYRLRGLRAPLELFELGSAADARFPPPCGATLEPDR